MGEYFVKIQHPTYNWRNIVSAWLNYVISLWNSCGITLGPFKSLKLMYKHVVFFASIEILYYSCRIFINIDRMGFTPFLKKELKTKIFEI